MIYHITFKKDWGAVDEGHYETESLDSEGSIHCSPLEKLEESANKFFKKETELLILCIDEKRVRPEITWEDLYNSNFKFPHIYGKLNTDAVLGVIEWKQSSGVFKMPEAIMLFSHQS